MSKTEFLPTTQRRLVAIHHEAEHDVVSIEAVAPWADATASLVMRAVEEHAHDGTTIHVDLHSCQTATVAQLACLITALRSVRRSHASMYVTAPPCLRELASVCRLDGVLRWS